MVNCRRRWMLLLRERERLWERQCALPWSFCFIWALNGLMMSAEAGDGRSSLLSPVIWMQTSSRNTCIDVLKNVLSATWISLAQASQWIKLIITYQVLGLTYSRFSNNWGKNNHISFMPSWCHGFLSDLSRNHYFSVLLHSRYSSKCRRHLRNGWWDLKQIFE